MESDLQQYHPIFNDHQHPQNQPPVTGGLTRFRSAPSSYFTDIIDREFSAQFFNRPSSPETERIFARFMNSGSGAEDSLPQNPPPVRQNSSVKEEVNQLMTSMNNAAVALQQHQSNIKNYSSAPQNLYQSSLVPPLPNQSVNQGMDGGYSGGFDPPPPKKPGLGSSPNLIRHSSSPAGLFSQINVENGYAAIRGMGNFGAGNDTTEEASFSHASRLKNAMNYSSGLMLPISEIGDKDNVENAQSNDGFTMGPWDDSKIMPDNITGLKRIREGDVKAFSGLNAAENQNEARSRPPLAHHLSLPNTSAEMAAIEKFLQLSDSVPCKIRAKRGCATHPRSIAERVRRTKISERMRKLQDLVPNMDKQTNTADMLDLAVDYIKDLQKQVQRLSDSRAKCTCSRKQQS